MYISIGKLVTWFISRRKKMLLLTASATLADGIFLLQYYDKENNQSVLQNEAPFQWICFLIQYFY